MGTEELIPNCNNYVGSGSGYSGDIFLESDESFPPLDDTMLDDEDHWNMLRGRRRIGEREN